MKITDFNVDKFYEDGPRKASVSITFENQLRVHNIRVIEYKNRLFIVMPSHVDPNDPDCYCDTVDTVDDEFISAIEAEIIAAYKEALKTRGYKIHPQNDKNERQEKTFK